MTWPRLARAARILFHEPARGYIVKTRSGSHLLPLTWPVRNADTLLELLDGSHDHDEIARLAGISIENLEGFLLT